MPTPRCVDLERRRMRRAGWTGVAAAAPLSKVRMGAHYVRVVNYSVNDVTIPHIELWETHDRARRARIIPVADIVHLVQNVGHNELKTIVSRRKPG